MNSQNNVYCLNMSHLISQQYISKDLLYVQWLNIIWLYSFTQALQMAEGNIK